MPNTTHPYKRAINRTVKKHKNRRMYLSDEKKVKKAEEIARDVKEFEANGGKVDLIPFGVTGRD